MWCSHGRSIDTVSRAKQLGLKDTASLEELASLCEAIFCVCPPVVAEQCASEITSAGFRGIYCDANALNPLVAARIAEFVTAKGCIYVDASIISFSGLRLYVSGSHASRIGPDYFSQCTVADLEVVSMGDESSLASASLLKALYSGYDKTVTALVMASHALATEAGIASWVVQECRRSQPDYIRRIEEVVPTVPGKAWRFVDEMQVKTLNGAR